MKLNQSRIAAIAVSGALVIGGVFASAASAQAATGVLAGTVTLLGQGSGGTAGSPITSGDVNGSGSASDMFYGFKVSTGCPAGDQGRSDTAVFQNNVRISGIAQSRNASVTLYGNTGLDGTPINMTDVPVQPAANPFVNNQPLANLLASSANPPATPLVAGAFDVRIYCSPSSAVVNYATDPYFDLPLTLNAALTTWSAPVVKQASSVSLTAAKNVDTTVTLTATVKQANGTTTATDAVGSVKFFSPAGTLIGSGTVTNGVATFTTAANAVGTYSYTAQFIGSSDPTYNDSPVSSASSVTFSGPNSGQTNVTVTIAAGANGGALTLSGVPATVALGNATLNGSVLTASAQLGTITVSDTRQVGAPSWNLTGQDTDFTSTAPVHTFDGGFLGWAPALVGTVNAGVAGPAVAPSPSGAGLKVSAAQLATGSVVAGQPLTTVGATLNLAVPSQTAAGNYSSTLTITLA